MHHLFFSGEADITRPICFLAPTLSLSEMTKAYLDPFSVAPADCMALTLHHARGKKKTPVKEIKAYIEEELKPVLEDYGVQYLVVTDSEYFKVLAKVDKVDANLGYVLDSELGPWKVVFVPNFRQIFYDPDKVKTKIEQGMRALVQHRAGLYQPPGNEVIKFSAYPETDDDIRAWLQKILDMECDVTVDIEAFSLKHPDAGIGTIAISWSQHEGICFAVDYVPIPGATEAPFGQKIRNESRRGLLRWFFWQLSISNRAIYHQISYDVTVLIYQLFMEDILDTEGLLDGLEVMLAKWHCTKLISYLATNSCAGNKLSLKDQAQEFAGNYGLGGEIKDITKIPLPKLLEYNLTDACSTWYVFNKNYPIMVADQQLEFYETIFQPAMLEIVQMQLTGLPVNAERVQEVKAIMVADRDAAIAKIQNSPIGQEYNARRLEQVATKKNEEWKKKRTTPDELAELMKTNEKLRKEILFNPGSDDQLRDLLYTMLGLPVLAYTDSKQASTKAEVIKDLKNHTDDPEIQNFLDALIDLSTVDILLTTFIPALEGAYEGPDGWHYLFGCFNLGGTISGRLSSSDPNLQNLPAGATGGKKAYYGKLIKSCIEAPPGKIFIGLDFSSLEDRISALTTKDPNKLKVYTDGYDGHSLRAYSYYTKQMPDIDPNSVASINSIADKYKALRAKSKNPTFTLTYQGTWLTLVTKYKFDPQEAKEVEAKYHELYKVSDQWVAAKLDQACIDGYVTVAFGLRVRTPLLAQVIRGTSKTPSEAEAEGRSAGNALGQSWCLLNSRAWSEFMGKVRKSEHRLKIRPCAQIHDAGYALVDDDVSTLAYVNKHLVKAVQWQNHPDIWHDQVKLGGELSVFWPTWANEIVIPNEATEDQLPDIIQKALEKKDKAA